MFAYERVGKDKWGLIERRKRNLKSPPIDRIMSFKKLVVRHYPSLSEQEDTVDSLYWRSGFEAPTVAKGYGAITHVEFCPSSPHDFAVTNSTRVQIYDSRSLQITRTLQRFQKQALSGSFRADGGLVVAGTEDGLVKVFDHQNQSLLR